MKAKTKYSKYRIAALLAALCVVPAVSWSAQLPTPASPVMANDNRHPAGTLDHGLLTVRLVARQGQWRPEEGDGPTLTVAAFGEQSGPLVIPSPIMRVVEGTDITVH